MLTARCGECQRGVTGWGAIPAPAFLLAGARGEVASVVVLTARCGGCQRGVAGWGAVPAPASLLARARGEVASVVVLTARCGGCQRGVAGWGAVPAPASLLAGARGEVAVGGEVHASEAAEGRRRQPQLLHRRRHRLAVGAVAAARGRDPRRRVATPPVDHLDAAQQTTQPAVLVPCVQANGP